jgi:hypothetical protein
VDDATAAVLSFLPLLPLLLAIIIFVIFSFIFFLFIIPLKVEVSYSGEVASIVPSSRNVTRLLVVVPSSFSFITFFIPPPPKVDDVGRRNIPFAPPSDNVILAV